MGITLIPYNHPATKDFNPKTGEVIPPIWGNLGVGETFKIQIISYFSEGVEPFKPQI